MKFYSELTGELYDSTDELQNAECEYKQKLAEQEEKENNKSNRLKEIEEAIKHSRKLIEDYIEDYGSIGSVSWYSLFW